MPCWCHSVLALLFKRTLRRFFFKCMPKNCLNNHTHLALIPRSLCDEKCLNLLCCFSPFQFTSFTKPQKDFEQSPKKSPCWIQVLVNSTAGKECRSHSQVKECGKMCSSQPHTGFTCFWQCSRTFCIRWKQLILKMG